MALCALVSLKINAQTDTQQTGGITTATPFLLIVPDARAGGMGDMGVATTADAFSLFHNPAKIVFSDRQIKTGLTYSPWLRNLTDDIFIGSGSYINRFSENSAWGADFKYFSLGQIDLTDNQGNPNGTINPNELVATGSYALKLSETFSMGVSLKYIRSNLAFNGTAGNTLQPINSFAVDVLTLSDLIGENPNATRTPVVTRTDMETMTPADRTAVNAELRASNTRYNRYLTQHCTTQADGSVRLDQKCESIDVRNGDQNFRPEISSDVLVLLQRDT